MATFTNIAGTDIYVSNEYGIQIKFSTGETRSGMSNYLFVYTQQGGAENPVLWSSGTAPEDLPSPKIRVGTYAGGVSYDPLMTEEDNPLQGDDVQEALDYIADRLSLANVGAHQIFDLSVNRSRVYVNHLEELVLLAEKCTTNDSGNFNGGGTGNKPIAGLVGFEGLSLSDFPTLDLEVSLRTEDTGTDADETQNGVSFNALLDLSGTGAGPIAVVVITNTLNAVVDKYGKTSSAASITDFDINAYSDSGTVPTMENVFYIVGSPTLQAGLPSYNLGSSSGGDAWHKNPLNLDAILYGTTMPVTGATFSTGYPNAKLVSAMPSQLISTDGGHPAGTLLSALTAQTGGSGNTLRSVTAITELAIDGEVWLPRT